MLKLITKLILVGIFLYPSIKSFSKDSSGAGSIPQIGTRAASMGNTFVAIADDLSTFYHNPAGIASLEWSYFSTSFQRIPKNKYFGNFAFVHSTNEDSTWAFGVSANFLYYHDIKKIDSSGNSTGQTVNYSSSTYFTIAKVIDNSEMLRIGANFKIIHQNMNGKYSVGGGIDVGILLQIPYLNFGVMIQDLVTIEKFFNRDKLIHYDRILKVGVSTSISDSWKVSLQVDKNLSNSTSAIFRIGGYFRVWQGKGKMDYSIKKIKDNQNLASILKPPKEYPNELYINLGYGGGDVGVGLTLKIVKLKFDLAISFSELDWNKMKVLFTLDIPLY